MPLHNTPATVARSMLLAVLVAVLSPLTTPVLAQAVCVAPPPNIIDWWPLDENSGNVADDKIGNHSAAYANGPTPTVGKVRGGLRFNGSNYLAAQDSDIWAFGARDFTIELWVNLATPGGGDIGHPSHIFIGNDEGPGNRNKWFFALGGGYLNFHINGPALGPQFFPLVPFSPTVGIWYHLAVVRRGSTYTIFINGSPAGSATNASSIPNPNAPLTIGQAENLGFMNGVLDEISIYSRGLSPEELRAIYDAGTAGKCLSMSVRPSTGGDTGMVTVHVNGAGFVTGATLKLTSSGHSDILASNVVVGSDGTALDGTVDLTGQSRGAWNIIVTNPSGVSFTLTNGFTIEAGRAPQVWVDILGLNLIRPGRPQSFQLLVGNRSNVDAIGVPVWISGIPRNAVVKLGFSLLPPYDSFHPSIDYSSVPTTLDTGTEIVVPLLLPTVPAGSSSAFEFTITAPDFNGFTLQAWSNSPIIPAAVPAPGKAAELLPSDDAVDCTNAILDQLYKDLGDTRPCVFQALQTLRDVLLKIGAKRGTAVNLFWSVEKLVAKCAQGKLCAVCVDTIFVAPEVDAPICLGCIALWIANQGQELWDNLRPHGTLQACFNFGMEIGDVLKAIAAIFSFDPNAKVGSQGTTAAQFISGQEPIRYSILFENLETATAPVQEVTISDSLDLTNLDLNTLALGPIGFGSKLLSPPPGASSFATDVDLRPGQNLIVRTTATLNGTTGLLTWRLAAIDPTTGSPPADPRLGFLPPDIHPPEGEGSVVFTVMSRPGLATGTQIRNQATIQFDVNPPINTPVWLNTLDNANPTSRVLPLPSQSSTSFPVQWAGTDLGSGIQNFTIYVSDNGGAFLPWMSQTSATSGTYAGAVGHTYSFYSIAQDRAANVEPGKMTAEATTSVGASSTCVSDHTSEFVIVRSGFRLNNATRHFLQTVTITRNASQPLSGPFALAVDNLSSTATLYGAAGATACALPAGSPFVLVNPGPTWNPGQAVTVNLEFVNPTNAGITYTSRVLAGGPNR